MFRGTVKFRARIVDTERGLTIPEKCQFNPNKTGVEKVEIECANGTEIVITVHFASVGDEEVGIAVAGEIHKEILDRVSIARGIAIENGRVESALSPTDGQSNVITPRTGDIVLVGEYVKVSLSLSCADLNPILEEVTPRGSRHFGLFRSALLSTSPVEEFMHLYNILLMLFDDEQAAVDDFITTQNPGVAKKQRPPIKRLRKRSLKEETVYTRLRNELGHKRADVNLDDTKADMKKHLSELITLTKRAIELHS
jgi:hypothetical protein